LRQNREKPLSGPSSLQFNQDPLELADIFLATLLALVAGIILFPGLGAPSLVNWDEAIYGRVTREWMAGPVWTLHYKGQPWFEKPPLLFWLMAGTTQVFGESEFALRLPSAICGTAAIVLAYFMGRRLGGRIAGVLTAIMLLGVPQFIAYSRLAMTDVPLVALGLLSIVLLVYGENRPKFMVAAGAAFGLAILTKSVAALLFLPGIIALVVAQHGWSALRSRAVLVAAGTALAVALPWPLASAFHHSQDFSEQIFYHVVRRLLAPIEGHEGGAFFYFDLYWQNAGLLAPVHGAGLLLGAALAILRRDRALGAAVVLGVGAFIIVCAQGTKIGWYLTPVYPGAALSTALVITRITGARAGAYIAAAALSALIVPGILYGRGRFIENYNIVDFSPEVRALRNQQPFGVKRVPRLYLLGVSEPAPLFYLADEVITIDQAALARLVERGEPFLCLTDKGDAAEFLNGPAKSKARIVAATQSLAVLGRK
jgi:4-amino-4-deoxy-L-arabinose transferase-like glycosyltransferase